VTSDLKPIRRALLSVTDKSGLVEFATRLSHHGVDLISTGGTARALREANLPVRDIADLTGFPEMLDGRVKTLHPKVHGGILHIRDNPDHIAAVEAHAIEPIDMVVVNLYAFEKTAQKPGVTPEELIENIDIGGPSMLRSAAKNFEDVAVVTSPADYPALADELAANSGALTRDTRWRLAKQAFATTAAYDSAIASTLESLPDPAACDDDAVSPIPRTLRIVYPQSATLRYGENPHQQAALFTDGSETGIAAATQLQGKELSYNNLVDLDACWELVSEFDEPAVVIIKHTNPAGAATGGTVLDAYVRALDADPVSAFGGVIGINREVDAAAAEEISKLFVEAIVAPSYTPEALERFAAKRNLRLLKITPAKSTNVYKHISGGMLVQTADRHQLAESDITVATRRKPTADELRALVFAWTIAKHVKSNAIVYARLDGTGSSAHAQTVGIGAGQMSRVDSARFGAMKAVLPLRNSVAASDAFFPFPDGLEVVAQAGATAVIQPGGSVRDKDVIEVADRLRMAMVFTGIRHFRHG
jgi:phosphoribosylaminoimidazolecarboxamide formyltransferase/IMP cyclohydrolase